MNGEVEVVFLYLSDVDRILRTLYHGSRPPGVRFLICACGRHANLRASDAEALGWQVLPHAKCPVCRELPAYEGPARERFNELIDQLCEPVKGGM